MASEREDALRAVVGEAADQDEKLSITLLEADSEAEKTKRIKLFHDHEMNKLNAELGWFGRLFGGESHAAVVIAFIVVILGFITAAGLWTLAYLTGHFEFWASEAHIPLGAAISALSYVFGRGTRDHHRHIDEK